jgi:hypothetical protein
MAEANKKVVVGENTQPQDWTPTMTGEVSADQIAAWKKEHGLKSLKTIVLDAPEGPCICYLKPPDKSIKSKAMQFYGEKKVVETGEFIIQNCWLGGDPRMKGTDESLTESAAVIANDFVDFIPGKTGEV